MPRRQTQLRGLALALTAFLIFGAFPTTAGQLARQQKVAAAAGAQPQSRTSTWRVLLVASDAVHAYRVPVFLNHVDFGKALVAEAQTVFAQTFASVKTASDVPTGPNGYDGIDLVVVLEVPRGEVRMALFSNPMTLTATFVVRNTKGLEIFRAQETANDNAQNLPRGRDRLAQAVSRQFVNDLLSNANVRNALAPPAPVEVKPVLADTAEMDSSGLEVPPPPPWTQPARASAPAISAGSGRP